MTIRSFYHTIFDALQPLYDSHEAAAIAKLYLQTRLSMQAHELFLRGEEETTEAQEQLFRGELTDMVQGKPVQYVLGETEFYGLRFEVSPAVLIPRPETEELVLRVVETFAQHPAPRIWDVGTGSGCIAVTLAKQLPKARIYASDISEGALTVARANARAQEVPVTFARHDMRDAGNLPFPAESFDAIVSNPPYIPEAVRPSLHRNVIDHEPATALFVPDDRPLVFYEALAHIGKKCLYSGGMLLMETFEDYHQELQNMLRQQGYRQIQSITDLNGKKRFCSAVL
ncbi:MAG: peptide chain release factor N(5)-glutamine methyltransferase [Bacteroidales bacterium]|nr:peptide chain release factor N(5)-glutamine methyltransferase [Bacteroidales bacterium]